jgi:nitrate reductase gamma subunit
VRAALLVAWFVAHYAYRLAPVEWEADASNIGRSVATLILLAAVSIAYRSRLLWLIAFCFAFEEAQVIGCTVMWLQEPWTMLPGMERCSEKFAIPMGAIGLACIGVLCAMLLRKLTHGNASKSV